MSISAANVSLSKFNSIKRFIVIVFLFVFVGIHGQVAMSTYTKMRYAELIDAVQKKEPISKLKLDFSIDQLNGTAYVNLLAKINSRFSSGVLRYQGVLVGTVYDSIATMKFPLDQLLTLESLQGVDLIEFSEFVQQQHYPDYEPPSLNKSGVYAGEGIVLGLFGNPFVKDFSNGWTKLLGFWDQFKTGGPTPTGFEYGVESSSLPEYQAYSISSATTEIPRGFFDLVRPDGILPQTKVLAAHSQHHEAALIDAMFWMHTSVAKVESRLLVPLNFVYREDLYPIENSIFSEFIQQLTADGTVVQMHGASLQEPVYVQSLSTKSAVGLSLNRKSETGFRNYMIASGDASLRLHFSYSYPVPLSDSIIQRHVVLNPKQTTDTLLDFGAKCFRLRMYSQPVLTDQQKYSSLIEVRTDFELTLTCWFDEKDSNGYLMLNPCIYHKGNKPLYDSLFVTHEGSTVSSRLPVFCDLEWGNSSADWKGSQEKLTVYAWMIEAYPEISVNQMHDFWKRVRQLPGMSITQPCCSSIQLDSVFQWCKALKQADTTFLSRHTIWHVFPLQVQRLLYVDLVDELPAYAEFIDEKGEVCVKKISGNCIDVSSLRPGNYTIRLLVNGILEEQKFIKL